MRFTKRLVNEGHVTVPRDLRNAMEIGPGDLVEFQVLGVIRRKSASASRQELQFPQLHLDS